MIFSFCIITKNESTRLEKCLLALRAAFGSEVEIVVVDTGSSDDTCEMAGKYTDKLFYFEWIGDFAAAKNYAAACASNDIVWIMDSDEYVRGDVLGNAPEDALESESGKRTTLDELNALIETHPNDVGRMCRINDTLQGEELTKYTDWTNRIFDRNRFCFKGKIHEQIVRGSVFTGPSGDESPYVIYRTNVIADHDGYVGTAEERKKKAQRNADLLLKELEERPEDTYILYQTGKAFFLMEEFEKSVEYFERAVSLELNPSLEYVIDLIETYGYALINSGHPEVAASLESVATDFGQSSDYNFMLGIAMMQTAQFDKAADYFEKAVATGPSKMQGVDSYLAWYNIGVMLECLGLSEDARAYYGKCGDYSRAVEALNRIG